MTTVKYYTPSIQKKSICSKGGLHENQPLNMVCLDKLCRNNPLICSICFSQTCKYHKVVGLNKFIDDYHRNASDPNSKILNKKINKHYEILKQSMQDFRNKINSQLDKFMKNLQKYVGYLSGHTKIRTQVSNLTGLKLQPHQLQNLYNRQQLQSSIRFILNSSLFDDNLNMINLAELLKQDQDKVYALLDKMVYMTQYSQQVISQAVSSLNFAQITLKAQKAQFNSDVQKIWKSNPNPLKTSYFNKQKIKLGKLVSDKIHLIRDQQQKPQNNIEFPRSDDTLYKFSKYRHSMLTLKNQGTTIVSNISAIKPQFAIVWPNLNLQPQKTRQWSIKINNCRNLASANTMGLGIGKLSDLKLANFQDDPKNVLVVTSQGYVISNDSQQKTDFIYGKGDVLHFKYDPYYGLLQVKKQNGRKLTLKALQNNTQPVYICARLTYASDQVQIV